MKQLLMGNHAMAMGALHAGVGVVAGYPGTPSTEVLETVAKHNDGSVYVEWSINEKSAMEVGAGAAYCGKRVLVTMKQVGLNVASDPLMSLAYLGVEGGMVILVADDPGPISSQNEQDTRTFAQFSKLPIFDPASPEDAYEMMIDAFDYSEKYRTPVLFRPTTRVCHACATIDMREPKPQPHAKGFVKDSRFVIFPRLSYQAHLHIEKRNPEIGQDFSSYRFNRLSGAGKLGIVSGGVSSAYTNEALSQLDGAYKLLQIATPFPFPEALALEFLDGLEQVLVVEELDPVLERALIALCGKHHLPVTILGKQSGDMITAGENTNESVLAALANFLGTPIAPATAIAPPTLPIRPPVLCAGCPHRASFFAVKEAMKGKKTIFTGDIGCYTLGNAKPLDMVDTCLCMGGGITIAQGVGHVEPDTHCFAFVGDSTFFAAGITGVANAIYNQANMVLVVLDNSTTAMTGHQPHPGTGMTMMGDVTQKISIPKVLEGLGVSDIQVINPLDLNAAKAAVAHAISVQGVSAIIYKSPCIAVTKPAKTLAINDQCRNCQLCIKKLGCPALIKDNNQIKIDPALCFGCTLCQQVCPFGAIE